MKTKTQYKVWMVVEAITTDEEGMEDYQDVEDVTMSAGTFDSLEDAIQEMEKISGDARPYYF